MKRTASDVARLEGQRVTLLPQQLGGQAARVDLEFRAGDEGWDDAVLVWNGMVAVAPVAVLQPTSLRPPG
ncbi:MAG TPA: hypothetical protein VNP93_12845 [Gaiellaceae bacterium]|nr:hypothetical protein [Gaiellaceae bacterium]